AEEITEMAATARKRLAELHAILPAECAGVVLDVCGFEKGLQQIETERGWPRRSAKLVLRIALDRLAEHYRLSPAATGSETRTLRRWRRSEEHTSELQSREKLVCRLLLEKKKQILRHSEQKRINRSEEQKSE